MRRFNFFAPLILLLILCLVPVPVAAGISMLPGSLTKLQNVKSGPETHSPCHVVFPIKTHCPSETRWPWVGEHTDEVLRSELGLDDDDLTRLRAQGIIG